MRQARAGRDGLGQPRLTEFASVPDEIWTRGVIEYKDLLKLIVCTEEFDARLLEQPTLDMPRPSRTTRGLVRDGSLNRLLQRGQTRESGIVGDTRSMVPSGRLGKLADDRPLADLYVLVIMLIYDYMNTIIEKDGRLLKQRLEAVGLGAVHGKVLDIAAHSMGGLVSRRFIEREGGSGVARRLVMLGTPDGGSPWPRVVDWATVALGLGLSHLTAIAWPASILGGLAALIEDPKVALDEMRPGSGILDDLRGGTDPCIPYAMIAGNTSIIASGASALHPQPSSPPGRLLERLTSPSLLHEVANPFFLDRANDVAVSVTSMGSIAPDRKAPCDVRQVACDHLGYFRDPAGLESLATILAEEA